MSCYQGQTTERQDGAHKAFLTAVTLDRLSQRECLQNTIQYSTMQYSTRPFCDAGLTGKERVLTEYNTVQYSAVQHKAFLMAVMLD